MGVVVLILLLIAAAIGLSLALFTVQQERQKQLKLLQRMRRDSERQERTILRLSEAMKVSMQQVNQLSQAMEARQERLRRTLDARVGQMQQANDRSLEQVSEKLAQVHRGLGEMQELTSGMTDLKRMLTGVKTRGIWGEVQLGALMSELFAPGQYVENAAIPAGSQQRVEFALKLPQGDGQRLLPIDSKFPQEDYLRLLDALESGDRDAQNACAAQLERAVLEQARRIHDKYIRPPETTDFAVMFLPTESLYAEVARREALLERTQERYRVLISGPATLAALLTSLQMGLRSLTLEKRSGEVLRLLSSMRQDFTRLEESVQRMRQRLNQTAAELDTLEARTRKAVKAIDDLDGEREQGTGN